MINTEALPIRRAIGGAELAGRTIALAESRDIGRFSALLAAHGATVLSCPLLAILDAPNQKPIEDWLAKLIQNEFDDVIFLTGEGVQRLLEAAARAGIQPQVISAFQRCRKITRGPKPARALTDAGIRTDIPSSVPTTDGIINTLQTFELTGCRIGVQLYGEDPNTKLVDFLTSAGAHVHTVAPYVYAPKAYDEQVCKLIQNMAAGQIDMLVFTSAGQVRRIEDVAHEYGLQQALTAAMAATQLAAIGPIVVNELSARGWTCSITPPKTYSMQTLVKAIVSSVTQRRSGA